MVMAKPRFMCLARRLTGRRERHGEEDRDQQPADRLAQLPQEVQRDRHAHDHEHDAHDVPDAEHHRRYSLRRARLPTPRSASAGRPCRAAPGPVCADSTGRSRSRWWVRDPKISEQRSTSAPHWSGALMCCADHAATPESAAARAYSRSRSNMRDEVRTRSTGVISFSTVRIGLTRSVEPIQALAAPMRPPRFRNSSVSIANQSFSSLRAWPRARPPPSRWRRRGRPWRPRAP